jgi:hypothetical protein
LMAPLMQSVAVIEPAPKTWLAYPMPLDLRRLGVCVELRRQSQPVDPGNRPWNGREPEAGGAPRRAPVGASVYGGLKEEV